MRLTPASLDPLLGAVPGAGEPAATGVASLPPTAREDSRAELRRPQRTVARRVLRALFTNVGVIAVFALPGVAIFWHAWAGHLTTTDTCACSDAGQQVWFIAWPAYAIWHGLNPLFSSSVWFPHGINLLANQSSILIGVLLAPITWTAGPVASTNVLLTFGPALSCWGCWVACRRFTTWRWAPWIGGLLFGYSPFVFVNVRQGHPGLVLLVVPPLIVVALDHLLRAQEGRPWTWGLVLGLLVVAQFFISPEVLAITAIVTAVGLLAVAVMSVGSSTVRQVRYAVVGIGIGVVTAAALLAAPVWYMLAGPRHISGSVWPGLNIFGNNLNAFFQGQSPYTPGSIISTGPSNQTAGALGVVGPNISYLGVGLLFVALVSVVVARRRKITWVLLAGGAASFVLSLGAGWHRTDALFWVPWLPWQTIVKWPLFDDVLPERFSLITDLALAMLIAIGLDEIRIQLSMRFAEGDHAQRVRRPGFRLPEGRPWRFGVALLPIVLAAIAIVPVWALYEVPTQTESVQLPQWFTSTARHLPSGSVVLTYPFSASASLTSQPMVWQAVDDFDFRLAGGYVKVPGPGGGPLGYGANSSAVHSLDILTLNSLSLGHSWMFTPTDLLSLRSGLSQWKVSYVVVTAMGRNPVYTAAVMTAVTGSMPHVSHRAYVWNLRHAVVARTYDARAAASALHTCAQSPTVYKVIKPSRPLPQAGVTCVASSIEN